MLKYIYIYVCLVCFVFSQSALDRKVSIVFDREPIRQSLINLLNKAKINFIISNHFEKNRLVTTSFRKKSVRYILDKFAKSYLFEYTYNENESFVSIHYKPQTIQGYIVTITNEPIEDAIIYSRTLDKRTLSNENGYFYFENVVGKDTELEISHVQFYDMVHRIKKSNYEKPQTVYLDHKIYKYTEQSVFELPTLTYTPIKNEVVLNKFFKKGNISSDDVFQSIKMLPGIGGLGEGHTKILNRGTSASENQILFDNIPLYNSGHLNGFYSIFNPKTLDKIYLHRGVYASKYGGQLSGIIEVKGKEADYSLPKFNAGINNFSYYGQIELPVARNASLLLAGRQAFTSVINSSFYSKIRNFTNASDEEFTTSNFLSEITPDLSFQDFNGKLSYVPSKNVLIDFNFIQSFDESKKDDTSKLDVSDGTAKIGFNSVEDKVNSGYSINTYVDWSNRLNSEVSFATSTYTNTKNYNDYYTISWIPDSSYNYSYRDEMKLKEDRLNIENEYHFSTTHKSNFGLFYRKVALSESIEDSQESGSKTTQYMKEYSFYASHLWKLNDLFKADIGFRQNLNSSNDIYSFEPRLSLVIEPKEDLNFKLSFGKFHQTLYKLRIENNNQLRSEQWILADNDDVPVSYTQKLQLNVSFLFQGIKCSIDSYLNKHSNLINYHRFLPVKYPEIYTSEGNSKGIELFLERSFSALDLWGSYSYMNIDIPMHLRGIERSFNIPDHSIKFMTSYSVNDWQIGLSFMAQSGGFYQTEISAQEYDISGFSGQPKFPIFRLPMIHKTDLKIQKKINSNFALWNFSLSVLNIFDTKNVLRREMNSSSYNNNETQIFNDIQMIGVTPVLSIEATF